MMCLVCVCARKVLPSLFTFINDRTFVGGKLPVCCLSSDCHGNGKMSQKDEGWTEIYCNQTNYVIFDFACFCEVSVFCFLFCSFH